MLSNEDRQLIIDDINSRVSPYFAHKVSNVTIRGTSSSRYNVVPQKVIWLRNGRLEPLDDELTEVYYSYELQDEMYHDWVQVFKLGDRWLFKGDLNCFILDELNPKLIDLLVLLYEAIYHGDIRSTYLLIRQISAEKQNQISRNLLDVKNPARHQIIKPYKI